MMSIFSDNNATPVPTDWTEAKSIIKVIGVGGGGCNAVTEMFRQKIQDIEFVICNTDKQSLNISDVPIKICLGEKGLGAGCIPDNGRRAALNSIDQIEKLLSDDSEMVFITAGMGGGTGTGASPVIAEIAKKMGKLTVGVVTIPFRDEGKEFLKRAVLGIKELKKHVDSLIIIDNQKLYKVYGDLNIYEAFPKVDEVLCNAVKSISELITKPGQLNIDFADIKMTLKDSGMALIGTGTAKGPDRIAKSVEMAFESPLLSDCDLKTAKGVLVNITSSKEHAPKMSEFAQILEIVNNFTGNASSFKRGTAINSELGENINVTVIATGFEINGLPQLDIEEDNDRIIIGNVYGGSDAIPQHVTRINIPGISDNYDYDTKNSDDKVTLTPQEEDQEEVYVQKEEASHVKPYQSYKRGPGKPVLILENGDDIVKLETQPAYLRRNRKIQEELETTRQHEEQPAGNMKIEEINGSQHLSSNNSFLHQTQD